MQIEILATKIKKTDWKLKKAPWIYAKKALISFFFFWNVGRRVKKPQSSTIIEEKLLVPNSFQPNTSSVYCFH